MAKILEGRTLGANIRQEVKTEVDRLKREEGVHPHLAVLLAGDNEASRVYVGQKERACTEVGIGSTRMELPATIEEEELVDRVLKLNDSPNIHGILVQLPLPPQIDPLRIQEIVSPMKDVDAFHPFNVGKLFAGRPNFVPCTPGGVLALMDHYGLPLQGREVVIVGRSPIVGRPLVAVLLGRNATVTTCHSHTRDVEEHTRRADVIIVAVGRAGFLKADDVSPKAVVIDVGITRVEGKLVGDVDFPGLEKKVAAITPVPGGVGPLTVAMLMRNVLRAVQLQR
ncbi:MAG: bifunctional 5,10-methylenetetrahydrofolate dehydrogenase/5,10-methenyltetrahydrofolate cyclohydrolase [Nitrospirae bacterium]|nr:bifunctional 5,10-methylenetetrahydrofolate dehydrogenase/5,10-methenyltetrahydrofolate cyclohydrolase [Nitrospirota bacterium]